MPAGDGPRKPLFSVVGIPVTVDPWFVLGMILVIGIAPTVRAGIITAIALAAFTLLHELGHAVTAKRAGCTSAIRLGFLVAWASYATPGPLTKGQLVRISLMGPLVQILLGLAGLWALGGPLSSAMQAGDRDRASLLADVWYAFSWAGVLIGLLNLLPLWPLDGSHVLVRLLESPKRTRWKLVPAFARATLAICIAAVVIGVLITQTGLFADARADWVARNIPRPGDGPLTILTKELARLPVRLTEPFVILFVGLFCGMSSYQVVKANPRRPRGNAW